MEIEKDKILMKNNIMVKAKYDLNVIQNRVFQLILYKFQKNKEKVSEDLKEGSFKLCIDKTDIKDVLNKKINSTTNGISEILINLRKADIYFYNKDENSWGNYGFINGFTYFKDKEVFQVEISNKIYNLITNYLKGYTPINMTIFLSFKSGYTQRFYELLRLWSNAKYKVNYSIDELKELLMIENKYSEYKELKRRVIAPAIKELNEKSLMQVDFKENKTGRKVTSIDFIVKDNDKRKYFQDKQQDKSYQYDNKKTLMFNDYEQRVYDYGALEKKLLGWDNDD